MSAPRVSDATINPAHSVRLIRPDSLDSMNEPAQASKFVYCSLQNHQLDDLHNSFSKEMTKETSVEIASTIRRDGIVTNMNSSNPRVMHMNTNLQYAGTSFSIFKIFETALFGF